MTNNFFAEINAILEPQATNGEIKDSEEIKHLFEMGKIL
jgi:hypothetical protein